MSLGERHIALRREQVADPLAMPGFLRYDQIAALGLGLAQKLNGIAAADLSGILGHAQRQAPPTYGVDLVNETAEALLKRRPDNARFAAVIASGVRRDAWRRFRRNQEHAGPTLNASGTEADRSIADAVADMVSLEAHVLGGIEASDLWKRLPTEPMIVPAEIMAQRLAEARHKRAASKSPTKREKIGLAFDAVLSPAQKKRAQRARAKAGMALPRGGQRIAPPVVAITVRSVREVVGANLRGDSLKPHEAGALAAWARANGPALLARS